MQSMGDTSRAGQFWLPSVNIILNIRGATLDSSFDFGAEMFLIFKICTTVFSEICSKTTNKINSISN